MHHAVLKMLCVLCVVAVGCKTTISNNAPAASTQSLSQHGEQHGSSSGLVHPSSAQKLYEHVKPSLVAVQYTYAVAQ